jgi:hypothetical protein
MLGERVRTALTPARLRARDLTTEVLPYRTRHVRSDNTSSDARSSERSRPDLGATRPDNRRTARERGAQIVVASGRNTLGLDREQLLDHGLVLPRR